RVGQRDIPLVAHVADQHCRLRKVGGDISAAAGVYRESRDGRNSCELQPTGVALRSGKRARCRFLFDRSSAVDWNEAAPKYDEQAWEHNGRLSPLPAEGQRQLVALWRLDCNVNNGGYLQFLANHGRECYVYASQVLKKMGAANTAAIIDHAQALVDEHFPCDGASSDELTQLLPNQLIGRDGKTVKKPGSVLPDSVLARLSELSYEYMSYPDDTGELAEDYFRPYLARG